jgi:hypothetical protein
VDVLNTSLTFVFEKWLTVCLACGVKLNSFRWRAPTGFAEWDLIQKQEMWVFQSQHRHKGKRFFDVRSGRKCGQSGSSGPTKMNKNRGRAVLRAAQIVTVFTASSPQPSSSLYPLL